MSGSVNDAAPDTSVGRFASGLLTDDLPELPLERCRETVRFIERRVTVLPSITRFGVRMIGGGVHAGGILIGHGRVRRLIVKMPLPLLSEYPRLVRSLGYAYIWETWPDTNVDGSAQ